MTVLSGSSIATYEECHLQWYFTYVERRSDRSEAMDIGQGVHDYAEMLLSGETITAGPLDPEVKRLFGVFVNDVAPTYGEVLLVEAAFELDVEGITYTGFIDAVDREEVGFGVDAEDIVPAGMATLTVVRDLKTSKNRPRPNRYRDPMVGYYLGARELGYQADLLRLDYIVKTKIPYYWPEDQEVPDDDEIDAWAAKVIRVHQQIEDENWEATGLGTYHCSSCPFKDICGPYERYQELTSPIRKG